MNREEFLALTPDEQVAAVHAGKACRKGAVFCWCGIGFPLHAQCDDCRGEAWRDSHCICPPPPEKEGKP